MSARASVKVRGRKPGTRAATDAALAAELRTALADLERSPCTFWACDGPNRPRSMVTCSHCWGLRHVATVLTSLERRG
jgi:hypothetical protein